MTAAPARAAALSSSAKARSCWVACTDTLKGAEKEIGAGKPTRPDRTHGGGSAYHLPPTQPPGVPEPLPIVQVRLTVPSAARLMVNESPVTFDVEATEHVV